MLQKVIILVQSIEIFIFADSFQKANDKVKEVRYNSNIETTHQKKAVKPRKGSLTSQPTREMMRRKKKFFY